VTLEGWVADGHEDEEVGMMRSNEVEQAMDAFSVARPLPPR
jgi:hypothetical protein